MIRGWEGDIAHCGRCGKEIGPRDSAEVCWFCKGDLCPECWEQHGHCGHEEAEEINQRMRDWYASMEAE